MTLRFVVGSLSDRNKLSAFPRSRALIDLYPASPPSIRISLCQARRNTARICVRMSDLELRKPTVRFDDYYHGDRREAAR
jgi:hypothetical protein